jgi:DNA polymerase (family 10)
LSIERVYTQWEEIDRLNAQYGDQFRIFKSIESDILTDGSLDYPDDILAGFDLVIASVHSVLQMDAERATSRLIRAIEHPATRILGHPTGRLLLARPGYPVFEKKMMDACAANGVAIELNANPQRLDIDWTWIPYAMEKGIQVSINPDAHSKESIHYVRYGVSAARKGLLHRSACLNVLTTAEFEKWLRTS